MYIGLEIENHILNTQNEKRLNCCPILFYNFSIEINRCVFFLFMNEQHTELQYGFFGIWINEKKNCTETEFTKNAEIKPTTIFKKKKLKKNIL